MQNDRFSKKVINDNRTQISYGGILLGSVIYGDFGKYQVESSRPSDAWTNELSKPEADPHFDSMEEAMAKLYDVYKPQPV